MAYSRIRFEIQNSATMTLVHTTLSFQRLPSSFSCGIQNSGFSTQLHSEMTPGKFILLTSPRFDSLYCFLEFTLMGGGDPSHLTLSAPPIRLS